MLLLAISIMIVFISLPQCIKKRRVGPKLKKRRKRKAIPGTPVKSTATTVATTTPTQTRTPQSQTPTKPSSPRKNSKKRKKSASVHNIDNGEDLHNIVLIEENPVVRTVAKPIALVKDIKPPKHVPLADPPIDPRDDTLNGVDSLPETISADSKEKK
ncbi:unnamed protein product [Caenorhabditis auriculariae]|uniref:Uncharacterized protein n=1 Tax=Caenorhabditis auriculariae TaxID=2777116 RepID=A0A8S1GRN0_9PELO|nr:unnamed protein product [Caenorhabditis auriculariae]